MKTGTKIGIGLLSLLVLVLLSTVIALFTIDPNKHKPWIADKFLQQTGRSLTFEGDIGLTRYPWLGVSLDQVAIGNAPGFGDSAMFRADRVEVRVKLLPLLRQHYEIDTVRLHGAEVNLTVNEAGQSNWADLSGSSTEAASDSNASAGGLPLSDILIGGIDIQDVSVNYQDLATGISYAINNFKFRTDELVYGVPIALDLEFDASASTPALAAQVKLDGTINYDLDNGRYQLDPFQVEAVISGATIPGGSTVASFTSVLDLNLDDDTLLLSDLDLSVLGTQVLATINGSDIKTGEATYQSTLNLSGEDLSLLFKVAEIEPLATQLASLDSRGFQLQTVATLDLGNSSIDFSDLSANLLGASLNGNFLASNITSSTPIARGNIGATGENLPLLIEVLGQLGGGRDSQLSVAGRELGQVDNKAFSVNTEFDADLETGNVKISALDVSLLGATISGNLDASDVLSDAPRVEGKLAASGEDLPLLVQIAGWFGGGNESTLFVYGEKLGGVANKLFVANAEFTADLQQGNIEIPVLTVEALGLELNGNISSVNMKNRNGTINGAVSLSGDNLRPLLVGIGQPDLAEALRSLSLDVGLAGTRSDMLISPLQVNLEFAGPQIPNSPVSMELSAATSVNLEDETLSVDAFSLRGLGLDASGKLSASGIFAAPELNGQLELASFNLRTLLQQLNQPVPDTADSSVLQAVAMSTSFSGSTESLAFDDMRVALDQSTLSGNFEVVDFSQPAVRFDMQLDRFDADRYLSPPSTAPQGAAADPSTTPIPTETLRDLNVRGQFLVQELTVANLDLSAVSLTLVAEEGELSLAPLTTDLYQGAFTGNISLSVSQNTPVMSMDANLQQIDVGLLLQDLMDATYVTGIGNVQLALNGSGADTGALKRSLDGNGSISLHDGVLNGVDVASVLGQVETMIRTKRPGDLQRGEQTAFDTFAGNLLVNQGVISSNDLLIKSPGFQVSGSGVLLDLGNDTIDFNLVTSIDASTASRDEEEYDIGGYSLPIACSGTVNSPRCLPDAGEILRASLAREVQNRVGDLINRAIGIEEPAPSDNPDANTAPDAQPSQPIPATETPATQTPPPSTNPREDLIKRALERLL